MTNNDSNTIQKSEQKISAKETKDDTKSLEWCKLWVEVGKSLRWPIILLIFIFVYRDPLNNAVTGLINRLPSANKISIFDLSIELEKQALLTGDAQLVKDLKGLSPTSLEALIQIPQSTRVKLISIFDEPGNVRYSIPAEEYLSALLELEDKGLVEATEPLLDFMSLLNELKWDSIEHPSENRDSFIRQTHFLPDTESRIDGMFYRLSNRGEQAIEVIVSATLNLLKQTTE
jgi:hypothetical protein